MYIHEPSFEDVDNPQFYYNTAIPTNPLDGAELKVVAYQDNDYKHRMHIRKDENGNVVFVEGMCFDLLLALQYTLKFRYKPFEGKTWYGEAKNGTILGMTGQILSGEVDISIAQASMVMLMQAMDKVSYLIPTSYGKLAAFFQQPRSTQDVLCQVFGYRIWICWLCSWSILAITLFALNFIIFRASFRSIKVQSRFSWTRIMDLVLWCFATISGQGWSEQKTSTSIRAVFLVSMIFAYLINNFFSASLTSNLATETIAIKSFSDLAHSKIGIIGDRRLPIVKNIVQNVYTKRGKISKSNDTRKMEISNNFLLSRFTNFTHALSTIYQSAFITLEDAGSGVFSNAGFKDDYICSTISVVKINNERFPSAMFVRKGSELKEIFNRKISVLIERGINFRLNANYFRKTLLRCQIMEESYRGGLEISDITIAYYIGSAGCILSFISLLVEIWKRREKFISNNSTFHKNVTCNGKFHFINKHNMPSHFPPKDVIPSKHHEYELAILTKAIDGGVAGSIGTLLVFPFDLAKTRIQNQQIRKSDGKFLYSSIMDCLRKVKDTEGFRGLYRGLLVNILIVAPEKSLKLVTNDLSREFLQQKTTNPLALKWEIVAGAVSGFSQSCLSTPMDLLKIRLQDSGRIRRMSGSDVELNAKPSTARQIALELFRDKGIMGFYKGFLLTAVRNTFFSIVYFPVFYRINRLGLKRTDSKDSSSSSYWAFFSAVTAGGIAAVAATPIDFVKTRMQRLKFAKGETAYSGIPDAFIKILKNEGPLAFMRGAGIRAITIAPQFGIVQTVYYLGIGNQVVGFVNKIF